MAESSQRTVVLAITLSLHALMVLLLAGNEPDGHIRSSTSALEAEIISLQQPIPAPPPLTPATVLAVAPIDIRPPQLSFATPIERAPESPLIETEPLHDGPAPVMAITPPASEPRPDVGPRPISGPHGFYPAASIKAKESGKVLMEICVSPVGTVDTVQVARSSGFPRLDGFALHLASQFRFLPATRQGRPVDACARYSISFKLN